MNYTKEDFKNLFKSSFNYNNWLALLTNFFKADELRSTPELIPASENNTTGYYIGALNTEDNFRIGFFYYKVEGSNIARNKAKLRSLVKTFINPKWGQFDAALAVFSDGLHWRLSLISDIKGEATASKRYTYIFGDSSNEYNTPISRFFYLQSSGISFSNLKEAFSVEALTKQFYKDLFEWYQWAIDDNTKITFPNNIAIENDDRENIDVKIIRMITRLMFVWFIKQKGLVPNDIFDITYLQNILKNFEPTSSTDGSYYNAILQNLFFATLNRAIVDETGKKRRFAHISEDQDVKTLYRYIELFNISEEQVIQIFSQVPFLNGGLFECLDKRINVEKTFNYDGFSQNDDCFTDGKYKNRTFVPNELFFKEETGLFSILNRYNFTVEENTPNEQQVALDPELLGNIFENLLGAYNLETKETARNQSGSFYTPREIVNFMVDESILAYLGKDETTTSLFTDNFERDSSKEIEYQKIASRLKKIKVLDPACGSGAFPMGLLNRLVDLLQKINPDESAYNLKLDIIENCIYGSDIQSIAVQITKLRFFISLVCDCEKDPSKLNLGIPTLPNLETKFVAANSLIKKKENPRQGDLAFNDYATIKIELLKIRHDHFLAKSYSEKQHLRDKDKELRKKLLQEGSISPNDAKQFEEWDPYDQNAISQFFDPEWMFGIAEGFDIIIGNPPYISLQKNGGTLSSLYKNCNFKTFDGKGDIYCLFFERGWQLLKPKGHLCYITSNKWMRADYGRKTRDFFAKETNPLLLIDFGGIKIFESATVDTNILLFSKNKNEHRTLCSITNKQNENSIKQLSLFVQQEHTICNFSDSNSWVILSPIEQCIRQKIETVGTPLKEWNIQINYGIKTGCNEAFIINTDKRNEILSNCSDNIERNRTEELIRPIFNNTQHICIFQFVIIYPCSETRTELSLLCLRLYNKQCGCNHLFSYSNRKTSHR